MELNRFEKANVKRIFNATKSLRAKKARVVRVINTKMKEVEQLDNEIIGWEQPVISKYGKTSEEILKDMDAPVVEVVEAADDEEIVPIVEEETEIEE